MYLILIFFKVRARAYEKGLRAEGQEKPRPVLSNIEVDIEKAQA